MKQNQLDSFLSIIDAIEEIEKRKEQCKNEIVKQALDNKIKHLEKQLKDINELQTSEQKQIEPQYEVVGDFKNGLGKEPSNKRPKSIEEYEQQLDSAKKPNNKKPSKVEAPKVEVSKVKVSEIALQLGIKPKDVLAKASEIDIEIKSVSSSVTENEANAIYDYISQGKETAREIRKIIIVSKNNAKENIAQKKQRENIEKAKEAKDNILHPIDIP